MWNCTKIVILLLLALPNATTAQVREDALHYNIAALEKMRSELVVRQGAPSNSDPMFDEFEILVSAARNLSGAVSNAREAERLFFFALDGAYYADSAQIEHEVDGLFKVFSDNGLITERATSVYYDFLITKRRFVVAEDLRKSLPFELYTSLPISGEFEGQFQRVLKADTLADGYTRDALSGVETPSIIVIAHPNCRFSGLALRDIRSDDELRRRFEQESTWLLPPGYKLSDEAREKLLDLEVPGDKAIAFSLSDFPAVSSWGTPTIYILNELGPPIKLVGWRDSESEERIAQLRYALGVHD